MAKHYNKNIQEVIRLTREMMVLADQGDTYREDKSCGVLYGLLRDAAYKIRMAAENERQKHKSGGIWDILDDQNNQQQIQG
ncbi:hypothetical protein K8I28_01920 [bacterium]|nr:hypothetical protein [bacterium]